MLLASFLLFFWGAIVTVGRLVGDWWAATCRLGDEVLEIECEKSCRARSFGSVI
jgi:hypothetical protein